MENKLPQKTDQQEISLIRSSVPELSRLSDKAIRILKVVGDVNDCVGFKMDISEMAHWSQELERLCPDSELHKLRFLMDAFKTDQIVWDRNKGIQNIFNGLRLIKKTETGYEILKAIW